MRTLHRQVQTKKEKTNLVSLNEDIQDLSSNLSTILLSTNEPPQVVSQSTFLPQRLVEQSLIGEISKDSTNVLKDNGLDRVVGKVLGERKLGDGRRQVGDGKDGQKGVEGKDGGSLDVSESRENGISRRSGSSESVLSSLSESSELCKSFKEGPKSILLANQKSLNHTATKAYLGESSSLSNVGNTRNQNGKVGGSHLGVSNELDQVGDNDTGHSGSIGGSLLEGSNEKGNQDSQDGSGHLGNERGGRKGLNGGGHGSRGSHGVDQLVKVGLQVRVVERSSKSSTALSGSGGDLLCRRTCLIQSLCSERPEKK